MTANIITEAPVEGSDWNLLVDEPEVRKPELTSQPIRATNHGTTPVFLSHIVTNIINQEDLTALNKACLKKKDLLIKGKYVGKLKPTPNLNNKRRRIQDSIIHPIMTPKPKDPESIINSLKAEIAALKQQLTDLQKKSENQISSPNLPPIPAIPVKNRFANLASTSSEMEIESNTDKDIESLLKRKNSQRTRNAPSTKRPNTGKADTSTTQYTSNNRKMETRPLPTNTNGPKLVRPPPINILYQDAKDTTLLLKTKLKDSNSFYIKRINNGKHALYVNSQPNYKIALELLRKCDTKFYTYTSKSDKPINLLLKGFDHNYNENEVLSELQAQKGNNINFTKVIRFTTSHSRNENITLPMFIVQVTPDSDLNNIKSIKYLFHHVITWNKLMRKDTLQCKRCQRISHAASNCNLPYRCVKCDKTHEPGQCNGAPGTQVERSLLYCVNCGNYGHPASYRGCPKMIEIKKRNSININNDKNNVNVNSNRNRPYLRLEDVRVRKGVSYADSIKNNNNNNPSRPPLLPIKIIHIIIMTISCIISTQTF